MYYVIQNWPLPAYIHDTNDYHLHRIGVEQSRTSGCKLPSWLPLFFEMPQAIFGRCRDVLSTACYFVPCPSNLSPNKLETSMSHSIINSSFWIVLNARRYSIISVNMIDEVWMFLVRPRII